MIKQRSYIAKLTTDGHRCSFAKQFGLSTDHIKPQIAFIQSQVVYDVELKVSSLSGLRFLFQQQ